MKIRPANLFPIDIGLAAAAIARWWPPGVGGRSALGLTAGSLVTLHLGFGSASSPGTLLDRLDFNTAFGLEYQLNALFGDWSGVALPVGGLSFAALGGITYFLTDSFAVQLRASYHAGGSSVSLGALLKVGPAETGSLPLAAGTSTANATSEEVTRSELSIPRERSVAAIRPGDLVGAEFAYLNLTSLYQTGLGYVGFDVGDESFGEGEAVRWRVRFQSGGVTDEITYTRALLRINSDGSKWWRSEFFWDGQATPFDYLVDRSDGLAELLYYDRATSQVIRYQPQDPDSWQSARSVPTVTREELESLSGPTERVRVLAGSFDSRRATISYEGTTSTVWLSGEVPGRLVKLTVQSDGQTVVEGELVETADGYTSPWGDPW